MGKSSDKYLVIRSKFNDEITQPLLAGAMKAFTELGIEEDQVCIVEVSGAFEIPYAASVGVRTKSYTAIIALGCVIRGDTPHFDYIAAEVARGLMSLSLHKNAVPIVFGVLTTNTDAQARERAGLDGSSVNRGYDAVVTALESCRAAADILAAAEE